MTLLACRGEGDGDVIYSFTFNGIKKDYVYLEDDDNGIVYPAAAPVKRNILTVPGVPGGYLQSTDIQTRSITKQIFFKVDTIEDLHKIEEDLADWLLTDEECELIFDDDPDRTYFAVVDGSLDITELVGVGETTITFLVPDGAKHGPQKSQVINDPDSDDADPVLVNDGTAVAYPILKAEVLQSISFLQVVRDDAYMQVGQPIDLDQTQVEEYESVLSDNLTSLVGWQAIPGGEEVVDGIAGGAMEVKTSASGARFAFGPSTYGDNPNGWVGPAVKKALDEALQDFRVVINMSVLNKLVGVGKVMLLLIDPANTIFGYLSMEDTTASVDLNHARIALLDSNKNKQFLIDTTGDRFNVYNNFEGILRLERRGTKFYAYAAQVNQVTGVHSARDTAPVFTDSGSAYQNQLAQVGIYIAKAKNFKTFTQTANDLSVAKINDVSANQVPTIATAGDIITFDHVTKKLMLNGDPSLMRLKDFGGTYFGLNKGQNPLIVNPADAVRLTADWRDNYK